MNEIQIKDISDYPLIKKLASALYQFDASSHGAAIMIGAGFSRSAARHVGGTKKMPLWDELAKKLIEELNPGATHSRFSDPLRIAEEYRACFGQAALNDCIRLEIDNDAWKTDESVTDGLYGKLLKLPWAEIMTTNWDTLLERAKESIHGPYYTTVNKPTDLTWAISPRIVKLHGSIGVTDSFIVAEEDYRTYPEKFAPFVNFARQVFIEKELCLLGFSGEDPNFLHWAGWIRDHLTSYARKIYLVGALKLTVTKRRYLESINIAPIDLWDAVKDVVDTDLRHKKATELFLDAMAYESKSKMRPHEWQPQWKSQTEQDIKKDIQTLRKDRESYPGWLVCPPDLQWRLQWNFTQFDNQKFKTIQESNPDLASKFLYEIAWCYNINFYISHALEEQLFSLANDETAIGINKRQQLEIAVILLKKSRCRDNAGDENYIKSLTDLLQKHARYLPDCDAELAYHQALVAHDALDYAGIEQLIERIVGEDPVWKLRKAALQMALGQGDEGRELITKAYGELRENHRLDKHSIPILSRLVWAHFLLKASSDISGTEVEEVLPVFAKNQYREWKCDPWTWIENIRGKIGKQQEQWQKGHTRIEPLFAQGRYKNHSSNNSFSFEAPVFLFLSDVITTVGIPWRVDIGGMQYNIFSRDVQSLVLAGGTRIELLDFSIAIRAASDEDSVSIKSFFSRIAVATASQDVVKVTVSRVLQALKYWREKYHHGTPNQKSHSISILRVFMEVLARLVVRLSSDESKKIFRLATELGKKNDLQQAFWPSSVFSSLLTNSLASIPKSEQGELLAEALAFPLWSETPHKDQDRWSNLVINDPNPRDKYSSQDQQNLDHRIGELITSITTNGLASSEPALIRLMPLYKKGFLTSTEQNNLANAIWGTTPNYQVLPNVTYLFPHAFLKLPAPDSEQVKALLSRYFYEHDATILTDTMQELHKFPSPEIRKALLLYDGMAKFNRSNKDVLPTSEQALVLFEHLIAWRPVKANERFLPFVALFNSERKSLLDSIGDAIAYAIAPALSTTEKNKDNFEKLKRFYQDTEESHKVLPAFVYFVVIDKIIADTVKSIITKSLRSRILNEVSFAAIAVFNWSEFAKADKNYKLPQLDSLIATLICTIASGRNVCLHQLLWVTGELCKNIYLSDEQISVLSEVVPEIFEANSYQNIKPESEQAVIASSVREACAKLAKIILNCNNQQSIDSENQHALEKLLESAKADALPEVRFAVEW